MKHRMKRKFISHHIFITCKYNALFMYSVRNIIRDRSKLIRMQVALSYHYKNVLFGVGTRIPYTSVTSLVVICVIGSDYFLRICSENGMKIRHCIFFMRLYHILDPNPFINTKDKFHAKCIVHGADREATPTLCSTPYKTQREGHAIKFSLSWRRTDGRTPNAPKVNFMYNSQ